MDKREAGRRMGEGEASGAREWFCSPVSCLLLARPPVQELDPHPHPGGSQTGRVELPPALSQEGLRAEQGKGLGQGNRKHSTSTSNPHPSPVTKNTMILGQHHFFL